MHHKPRICKKTIQKPCQNIKIFNLDPHRTTHEFFCAAPRRYAFLAEREKEELKASRAYLKTKRGRRDAAARGDYERRVSKQRQLEHDERRRAVTARFRREERSKVKKTGKAPYYAKRSVLKGAVAQDRFADLKNRGKLGAFLAKRGRRAGLLEKGARKQGNDPAR